jgi:spore maturation protein CgeB
LDLGEYMLKRIGLLVNYNLYESKRYFTQKLSDALNRKGIETKIIDVKEKILEADIGAEIQNFHPDLTCSFNTLSQLPDKKFLWDVLKIPHLSILVDPALYSVGLRNSPYSIISSVDRFDCESLRSPQFQNIFFWPHATEATKDDVNKNSRNYDIVFLGTCYDYENLRVTWKQRLTPALSRVLDKAIEIVLSDKFIPLAQALVLSLNSEKIAPQGIDLLGLFYYLDNYTRGKDRVELIRSIKDYKVHIFGELLTEDPVCTRSWNYYLGSQANIVLHPSVPFAESLKILKQSRISLNSMPFFKNGSHERVFNSLACGALPVTTETLYFKEIFNNDQDIIFYQPGHWDKINESIHHFLENEDKRREGVNQGRNKILQGHTWDHRVDQLLQELPPILERMKKEN